MELAGFIVDRAPSGAEALEQVHRFKPDVILLYLMPPGLNGFSVVRALERG
jgi:DNA-binding response OmpR family regulator